MHAKGGITTGLLKIKHWIFNNNHSNIYLYKILIDYTNLIKHNLKTSYLYILYCIYDNFVRKITILLISLDKIMYEQNIKNMAEKFKLH